PSRVSHDGVAAFSVAAGSATRIGCAAPRLARCRSSPCPRKRSSPFEEAPMKALAQPKHGMVRGLGHIPRSPSFEGRFGRMFRSLPPAEFRPELLAELAKAMMAERGPADAGDREGRRGDFRD